MNLYSRKFNCSDLTRVIRELASQAKINDYNELKNVIRGSQPQTIGYLLVAAARRGVIRDVKLLSRIAIAHDLHRFLDQALLDAAINSHVDVMDALLQNGADIHHDNDIVLRRAVITGQEESVEFLLKNGANVHVDDNRLLLVCCKAGDYNEIINLLIVHGINVFTHYQTALDCCLDNKHSQSAELLIRYSDTKPVAENLNLTRMSQDAELEAALEQMNQEIDQPSEETSDETSDVTSDETSDITSDEIFDLVAKSQVERMERSDTTSDKTPIII